MWVEDQVQKVQILRGKELQKLSGLLLVTLAEGEPRVCKEGGREGGIGVCAENQVSQDSANFKEARIVEAFGGFCLLHWSKANQKYVRREGGK